MITSKKEAVVNPVDVIFQYMDRLKRVKRNSKWFLFPALQSTSKGDSSLEKPASYNSVLDQFKSILISNDDSIVIIAMLLCDSLLNCFSAGVMFPVWRIPGIRQAFPFHYIPFHSSRDDELGGEPVTGSLLNGQGAMSFCLEVSQLCSMFVL